MKLVGVRGKEADDEMDAKRKDGLKQKTIEHYCCRLSQSSSGLTGINIKSHCRTEAGGLFITAVL